MSDTVEPIQDEGALPPLRLCTRMDRAAIERLRPGLAAAYYDILMTGRDARVPDDELAAIQARYATAMARHARYLPLALWLGLAGLALSLAFAAGGGIWWAGYRLDIVFALFFAAVLALVMLLRRLQGWQPTPWYWLRTPGNRLRKQLARALAARVLRPPLKLAPFEAHYDFSDGTVTYTRVTQAGATLVWQGPLEGWRVARPGFTLLFKGAGSLRGVLVMHEPCARLDQLLARHGVKSVAPA